MFTFRPLTPVDRPAVLDICATVWDGQDYLPDVFDAWLAEPEARFIGCTSHNVGYVTWAGAGRR
jgi:hypothetical protein